MSTSATRSASALAVEANGRLARTINAGIDFGASLERRWTVALDERRLDLCAEAGFTAVRFALSLGLHRDARDRSRIDPRILRQVQRIVEQATARGLAVVVCNFNDHELMADPGAHRARLLASTRQLAEAVADRGPEVVLEPMAEPHFALDACWNEYLAELIATVRAVDRDRTLIVGPGSYNNARFLPALALPADERNLIVTIHHYWPIRFTMQGETWLGENQFGDPASWVGTAWTGTEQERGELEVGFEAVAAYARAHDRPLFLGEFGTSNNADMASRVRWTRFNRQLAERHGFSWGCWCSARCSRCMTASTGAGTRRCWTR